MGKIRSSVKNLRQHIKRDRKAFLLYSILRVLVLLTLVRSVFTYNFESAAICVLSLILFLLPAAFEKTFHSDIPTLFEMIIYLFIFSAEILGEINHYYVLIPGWDTMLHTMNGFLFAVVGFSMVDLLDRKSKKIELSPLYVSIFAFCFSMTAGTLWELFEFGMDKFFLLDMQKDFIVSNFGSVSLDPNHFGTVVKVSEISDTVIHTLSGNTYTITGGYLDIGILDTMKDLLVNFVGAIVFSIIGYSYINNREKKNPTNKIAEEFIIRREDDQK